MARRNIRGDDALLVQRGEAPSVCLMTTWRDHVLLRRKPCPLTDGVFEFVRNRKWGFRVSMLLGGTEPNHRGEETHPFKKELEAAPMLDRGAGESLRAHDIRRLGSGTWP